jgi:hypothetical protein
VPYSAPASGSSNHIGTIAGGVAGGVVALVTAIVLLLFCWRRNRRPEEPGVIFDPDRVVRDAGQTDLEGAEITSFSYEPTAGTLSGAASPTFSGDGSMRQYRDSQALLGGSMLEGAGAGTATATSSHYAPSSSDGVSVPPGSLSHARSSSLSSAGLGPGFPVAQPRRALSAKEVGLATAIEEGEGIVVQHSDGGHVAEPTITPKRPVQEIPPSYDSIPGNPGDPK